MVQLAYSAWQNFNYSKKQRTLDVVVPVSMTLCPSVGFHAAGGNYCVLGHRVSGGGKSLVPSRWDMEVFKSSQGQAI